MSRIKRVFDHLKAIQCKALIPFITAGDPYPSLTVPLMHALARSGADIIELGIPFSDPMADGPTIQRASDRALKHGVSLVQVLQRVSEFRETDTDTPVVLMGYANPIESYGAEAFAQAARAAQVDGVLVVDYPPEEAVEFAGLLHQQKIDPIFLLAPTSTEARYEQLAALGSGYVYYVALKGVTGSANLDIAEVASRIPLIRQHINLPIGVGFGIRDALSAQQVAAVADAVVIGSRLIEEIEACTANNASPERIIEQVSQFIKNIRQAMDT